LIGLLQTGWNAFNSAKIDYSQTVAEKLLYFAYTDFCPAGASKKITNEELALLEELNSQLGE